MHSPSASRAILRDLRNGTDPAVLIPKALKIPDPDHAARTLFVVSSDRRLPWEEARRALRKVELLVPQVEKPSRVAELVVEILRKLPEWRAQARNPEAPGRRQALKEVCIDVLTELPPGPWTDEALGAAATERPVFDRAVELKAVEPIRKALLEHPKWLRDIQDAKLRALCGDLEAVWNADAETARVVAWHPHTDPERFAQSAPDDPEKQVLAWTLAGARLDKEGKDGVSWLKKAHAKLPEVAEPAQKKLGRKLAVAMEKAGLSDAPSPQDTPEDVTPQVPSAAPAARHVLGLVDGYQGSLKPVHLRALARAAPLCVAFNLDLGLYGFPTDDVEGLIQAAAAETNVGEGEGYLETLHAAGRIHVERFPGPVVASTPHPAPEKRGAIPKQCVMLMGLGRQGLPKRYLDQAQIHYEITGQDVSLETATAMGILAERLRQG